jgi:hypothetical protein
MTSIRRFRRKAIAAALAVLFPAAAAADVARVDFAVGTVTAVSPDGRTRALTRGSEIDVGDTVNTQQGRAQLRFEDGAYMSLQPETAFRIEQFRFVERGQGGDNIVMHLLKGGMRTITGLIGRGNRENYKFRTEVATIGIRGTEFSVRYTNSIEVFCAEGAITVENEAGTVVLGAGQGGYVPSVQQQPQRTELRPFLPPMAASGIPDPALQVAALADPVNPIQEAIAPIALPILTGTFTGNAAVSLLSQALLGQTSNLIGESVTLDSSGALTSFVTDFDGLATTTLGTASAQSAGNDGIVAWGRWVGGSTEGAGSLSGLDLAALGALHYVVGLPATNMPTGQATYAMIGSTAPTLSGLRSVVIDSSSIVVDFAQFSAFLHAQFTVDGSNVVSTADGGMLLGLTGARLNGATGTLTGPFLSQLSAQGFLAGDGASRAGLVYDLSVGLLGVTGRATGAIAYQKTTP